MTLAPTPQGVRTLTATDLPSRRGQTVTFTTPLGHATTYGIELLATGELVPILHDYQLDPVDVHAVYPGGRRPSIKVRAFSDYLAAQLAMNLR